MPTRCVTHTTEPLGKRIASPLHVGFSPLPLSFIQFFTISDVSQHVEARHRVFDLPDENSRPYFSQFENPATDRAGSYVRREWLKDLSAFHADWERYLFGSAGNHKTMRIDDAISK